MATSLQDYYGNISGYGSLPSPQPTAISGNIASMPNIGQIASGINSINLGYQAGAIPQYNTLTGNVSDQAAALLDPMNAQANYDVSMHGAENAIGRGIAGSGAAAETTGRMRQADIERRAMLGNELLSSQVSRLPKPFDPASQLLTPSQLSSENTSLLSHLISRGQPDFNRTGGISYPDMSRRGPTGEPAPFEWTPTPGDAGVVGAYGTPSIPTLSPRPMGQPPVSGSSPLTLPENFDTALNPLQQMDYLNQAAAARNVNPAQWGGLDNPSASAWPNTPQGPLDWSSATPPQLGSDYFSEWDLANPVPADYGWLD